MQGLLCFGSRKGKQFTFTLLDEWIPPSKSFEPGHALAELTKRYFTSHGPATIPDFIWWSGLTVSDAKEGLAMLQPQLTHKNVQGQTYWFASGIKTINTKQNVSLLSAYDEYTVSYSDRSAIIRPQHYKQTGNGLRPVIVINGQIAGTWKRELKKHQVIITPHLLHTITKQQRDELHKTANRFADFLNRKIILR